MCNHPFARDSSGNTCIHLAHACRHEAPEVLRSFIEERDVLQLVCCSWKTEPLVAEECARIFLANGADPNYRPPGYGHVSLLYAAIEMQRYGVANDFIKYGADVTSRMLSQPLSSLLHRADFQCPRMGTSAVMHLAARRLPESSQTVRLLLAAGADVTVAQAKRLVRHKLIHGSAMQTLCFLRQCDYHLMDELVKSLVAERLFSDHDVTSIDELLSTPLTLQRLAANVIRRRLRPNALVGVKKLPLPPAFNRNFILLDAFLEFEKSPDSQCVTRM